MAPTRPAAGCQSLLAAVRARSSSDPVDFPTYNPSPPNLTILKGSEFAIMKTAAPSVIYHRDGDKKYCSVRSSSVPRPQLSIYYLIISPNYLILILIKLIGSLFQGYLKKKATKIYYGTLMKTTFRFISFISMLHTVGLWLLLGCILIPDLYIPATGKVCNKWVCKATHIGMWIRTKLVPTDTSLGFGSGALTKDKQK